MRRAKKPVDSKKKQGSFAFFCAVPCTFVVGALVIGASLSLLYRTGVELPTWALFFHALIIAAVIFGGSRLQRFKTLIHELKHVVLVVITGNKFKDIEITRDGGNVSYEVYRAQLHLEPFVILAPYFWPLLSLPTLIAAIAAELLSAPHYRPISVYALGFTLGADLITAVCDIHPRQSDLQRIFGGYLATRSFIFGFSLMWTGFCLLWISGGWQGYLYAAHFAVRIAEALLPQ